MQDQILVLGLTLRGVVLVSDLITNDDDAWWWVVLSFMCTLARCVLMAETLSRVRFYHRVQFCHVASLD